MPKHEQTIFIPSANEQTVLATCYAAFQQLNWEVKYASPISLFAYTKKSVFSNSIEISVSYENSNLRVCSEMISGEALDMLRKNKKNTDKFIAAFETVKQNITPTEIIANQQAIETLQTQTMQAAEIEMKELEELQQAMNLGGNLYVTYSIIALNILIFVLMAFDGAGIFDANGLIHIKWGSNYGPLTESGDWWRLLTSTFLHFGIIHLALNMYALYSIAAYLEPMLGKAKYIVAYLCTGILASVASLWWHSSPTNSAGASGSVFGMYGVFLALLTTNIIPKKVRQPLLQSIVIFVIYNLAYGLKGGIDNAAHVGGLLSGLVIGYSYAWSIKKEEKEQKISWMLPAIIVLSVGIAFSFLQSNIGSADERKTVLNEIKQFGYKDSEEFNNKYNKFVELQQEALNVYENYNTNNTELINALQQTSKPKWNEAESIVHEMKLLQVSDEMKQKADDLLLYIQLRRKEIMIRSAMITNSSDSLSAQYTQLVNVINSVVEKLK